MSYTKTDWVEGVTPLNPTNLNKIEEGIDFAHYPVLDPTLFDGTTTGANYPKGITLLHVNDGIGEPHDNQLGFPSLGTVVTNKISDIRLFQTLHSSGKNGLPNVWTRHYHADSPGWTEWDRVDGKGESWINGTLENGWSNYDTTDPQFPIVQYRKLTSNKIALRGMIKGGTIPSVAFTLPSGYRPLQNVYVPAVTSVWTFGAANINASGEFTVRSGSSDYFAFEIEFYID